MKKEIIQNKKYNTLIEKLQLAQIQDADAIIKIYCICFDTNKVTKDIINTIQEDYKNMI